MNQELSHLALDSIRYLSAVVADTSSLIYAGQAGFLMPMTRTVRITAPPGVFEELGDRQVTAGGFDAVGQIEGDVDVYRGYQVDAQVVVAAGQLGHAVLSDDLRLLARAADRGIVGYTVRAILELMLLRGSIDLTAYQTFKRSLAGIVRYALPLYVAAEELHWEIRKEIG